MPWTAADAARHNKAATGSRAAQWAAVANSVLAKTGDEARAIREANGAIRPKQGLSKLIAKKRRK